MEKEARILTELPGLGASPDIRGKFAPEPGGAERLAFRLFPDISCLFQVSRCNPELPKLCASGKLPAHPIA
jgi:hypothetical protein